MEKFNIKEWQDKYLTEDVNAGKEVGNLLSMLKKATIIATRIGKLAKKYPEAFEGTEGNELDTELQNIYAAFMTGNSNDKSHNDEIFK
jgi:hypothetical protein